MYESYFHLDQTPFSIAPDPAFLYLSGAHQEALAHLRYGFTHGGFVLITGEVGTGKTTLLRDLVSQTPEDLDVAFVLNPRLTVRELLETLCDELGVDYPRGANLSVKQYIDALNRHLLATHQAGRGTVMIIDEAQNLSPAVLEQIRLLTNLETDQRKLLRIILLGQPELADMLGRNELRQLAQRITARYHLGKLSREDTYAYVAHRITRAGGDASLFTTGALRRLYRISGGIPRVVNLIADRALLGAYAESRPRVTARLVNRAAAEVLAPRPRLGRWIAGGALAATATGAAAAAFLLVPQLTGNGAPAPAAMPDVSVSATLDSPGAAADTPAGAEEVAPAAESPAAAAAPAPPEPVNLERPEISAFASQRQAYRALFQRWDVDLETWPRGTIPCNFAPSVGLQCLSRTGSWSDIRRLNLPVILELWDQGSTPFYAAVTRMDDRTIDLHLGGDDYRVTPADLQDAWFGSYVVLWRMPPDYQGTLKRGDRHPTVAWLRSQLEILGTDAADAGEPAFFDAALQDAVLSFQRQEQLLADGIVGPATWIRLGERLGLTAPQLDGEA